MSIVKISAPLTGSALDEITLATAYQAAKPFSAYVDVFFVHRDPREAIPYSEMTLVPEIIQSLIDAELEIQRVAGDAARRSFANAAVEHRAAILDAPSSRKGITTSIRDVIGHLPAVLANAAILSDLVVIPPVAKDGGGETHDALVRVLTKVGRPVLLCASDKPAQLGKKIAIGWDGRDAAAKALVAAVPFLEKAESVELVSVGNPRPEDSSINEAREFLALHDIRCAERVIQRGSRGIADTLVEAARNSGCDLLVAGGYGHSRLVESIFGGVTDSIVSHPQLPILMVH
jgi:nucleotide-binding universal stress UspA family protein